MLVPDDICVNQWVMICDEYEEEDEVEYDDGYVFSYSPPAQSCPIKPGVPVQVRAVSLPFISVGDGVSLYILDTRKFKLMKVHPKYVKIWNSSRNKSKKTIADPFRSWGAHLGIPREDNSHVDVEGIRDKVREAKKDMRGCCPVCGERLVKFKRERSPSWMMRCKQCGFEGGEGNTAS